VKFYQANIKSYSFVLEGHTDIKGKLNYNYTLAQKRSLAVLEIIKSQFSDKLDITIKSDAYLKPIETNDTLDGRAKNRRVEFKLIKK
jgi:outer membrane protein OmpA-like peptidoglycan-associated protein